MRHTQAVKAAVATTTDLGQFSAIAAAYSVDRQHEQIVRGAFATTIEKWKSSGKDLPLHWNHQAGAESVIGSINPATMRETEDGLYVEGALDLEDSELAREAWRSLKKNRIGLSFGYMVIDSHDRDDGIKELRALDLFEITLTAAPANADTRVLSTKALDDAIEKEVHDAMVSALAAETKRGHSLAEAAADYERTTKGIDTRPAPRIVSFEC